MMPTDADGSRDHPAVAAVPDPDGGADRTQADTIHGPDAGMPGPETPDHGVLDDPDRDPFQRFHDWLAAAVAGEPNDPTAMTLVTVDGDGTPSARMVLLKGVDDGDRGADRGFLFYTNLDSRKGRALAANPTVALLFHWKSLRRQVRVEGVAQPVADAEADAYFASRPRGSQIGAWASDQSRPLESRWALEKRVAAVTARFAVGPVARPPHWSGFRVVPQWLEFWQDRRFRLHDRLIYSRLAGDGAARWTTERLYP